MRLRGTLPAAAGLVVLGIGGTLAVERAPRWRLPSGSDSQRRRVFVVGIFADPSTRSPRGRNGPNNTVFNGNVPAGAAATLFTLSAVSATACCWRSR